MRIRIILPSKTVLDQEADKITAPGTEGSFQLLPKHIDFVSSLSPGILSVFFEGEVVYYAINQGILVKQGDIVSVACLQAIRGTMLETLGDTVDASFRSQDENERRMNEVLTKLEVDTLRLFMELD